MTKNNNSTSIKWKNWWGNNGIGAYSHSTDPSWYKPHQNCKMQYLGKLFCSVCVETTIEKIHTLTNPIISIDPQNTGKINSTNDNEMPFSLDLLLPVPNTLNVTWTITILYAFLSSDNAPLLN